MPKNPPTPEILPPAPPDPSTAADPRPFPGTTARLSERIAWILDECVRVPGSRRRFGLDPIVGLIPYGGETAATAIGAVILAEAGRKGLPIRTLVRMAGNMILNAAVGAIPVVGDVFSFWFKSNSRNYRLLAAYLASDSGEQASGGWWPVLVIVGAILFVLACNIVAWLTLWWLLAQIWSAIAG